MAAQQHCAMKPRQSQVQSRDKIGCGGSVLGVTSPLSAMSRGRLESPWRKDIRNVCQRSGFAQRSGARRVVGRWSGFTSGQDSDVLLISGFWGMPGHAAVSDFRGRGAPERIARLLSARRADKTDVHQILARTPGTEPEVSGNDSGCSHEAKSRSPASEVLTGECFGPSAKV